MQYEFESDPFPQIEYDRKLLAKANQEINGLNSKLKILTAERDSWKDAWLKQRLATGKAWWEGYRKAFTYCEVVPSPIPYLETKK
jgi:hypothetical protein